MLLAEVTDGNNNNGSDALAEEWPPAEYFYKNFKDKIVEGKIEQEGKQVAQELYPSFQIRIYKHHILHQDKTNNKVDAEGNEQSGIVRFKCIESQLHILKLKNIHE